MKHIKTFVIRTFSSLHIRNYRLYFIGQAISLSGTWMQTIAQDWLVLQLSGSGTILGLVTACQFLPILLFGPFGGVIADRYPKRKILYCTQGAAALLALCLGILVTTGLIRLWMVFIFAPLLGLINTVDNPTRQTFVFEMVGKEQLRNAVALNTTIINLARVIGPSIAGILIATVGIGFCFLFNAISYIPVLIMLYMMHAKELHPTELVPKTKGQIKEGLKYVWVTPILRNTLIMLAIIGTFSYEFSVMLPLLARFTFHGNAGSYAALTASLGVGSVIGGLMSAARKKYTPQLLIRFALLFGTAILIASVIPNFFLELVCIACIGVCSINLIALGNTTLQLESKPEMRGRVMSLWTVAFLGSTPIGGPIIGFISEQTNPRWGLVVGGVAAIVAAWIGMQAVKKEKQRQISQALHLQNQESESTEQMRM